MVRAALVWRVHCALWGYLPQQMEAPPAVRRDGAAPREASYLH
jgi:hypothetical protein